ncbi:homeobox protein Wariai-like [Saccostrea cucullata]|uniref:homeobox protein Wariai-like n=1 Tax=Saccostrea cuccullata TaxID=36930 RepID=UPI002ED59CB8
MTDFKNACWSKQENIYAVHIAANFLYTDMLSLILNGECNVNIGRECSSKEEYGTKHGGNPLFIASRFGHHEIVQELISHGAKVYGKGLRNPILYPSYSGCDKTVALLITNGANINEKDHEGHTSLMNASRRGWIDVVKILLKNEADLNICDDEEEDEEKDEGEENALDMACSRGHLDIVSILLDHDIDINNNGNEESYTPLMHTSTLEGNHLSTLL